MTKPKPDDWMRKRKNLAGRLEDHSIPEPNTGCLLWMGPVRGGYGRIVVGGRKGKWISVHRASWEVKYGPIPDGLHVLHKCDNRSCLNPDHLFLGTNQDNVDDRNRKDRQAKLKGQLNGSSKLDDAAILAIRNAPGLLREIAANFGISPTHVSGIKRGTRWKHLFSETMA